MDGERPQLLGQRHWRGARFVRVARARGQPPEVAQYVPGSCGRSALCLRSPAQYEMSMLREHAVRCRLPISRCQRALDPSVGPLVPGRLQTSCSTREPQRDSRERAEAAPGYRRSRDLRPYRDQARHEHNDRVGRQGAVDRHARDGVSEVHGHRTFSARSSTKWEP